MSQVAGPDAVPSQFWAVGAKHPDGLAGVHRKAIYVKVIKSYFEIFLIFQTLSHLQLHDKKYWGSKYFTEHISYTLLNIIFINCGRSEFKSSIFLYATLDNSLPKMKN